MTGLAVLRMVAGNAAHFAIGRTDEGMTVTVYGHAWGRSTALRRWFSRLARIRDSRVVAVSSGKTSGAAVEKCGHGVFIERLVLLSLKPVHGYSVVLKRQLLQTTYSPVLILSPRPARLP